MHVHFPGNSLLFLSDSQKDSVIRPPAKLRSTVLDTLINHTRKHFYFRLSGYVQNLAKPACYEKVYSIKKPWVANSRGKKQKSRVFPSKCWSSLKGHSGHSWCLSSSCSHKLPQTEWLKRHLFLIVLESGKV